MAKPGKPLDLTKITIRLPAALIKRAQHHGIDTDQTLQDLVRLALEKYLVGRTGRTG